MISDAIALEVARELTDPAYAASSHGRRSGANAGCKGPLCRKFTRDRVRALYATRNPEKKRTRPGSNNPEVDKFLDETIQALALHTQPSR